MCAIDYGLIGHPLGHSLSPFIHHSILAAAALPGTYRLYDIEAELLPATVRQLSHELAGFNCTIPYKEAVISHLTGLEATAQRIMSVNTVCQGIGYNTDYAAFRDECPLQPGEKVLILGAGGVSRTMAHAAAAAGCETWIAARRPEQSRDLAAAVRRQQPDARLFCPESLDEWRHEADHQSGRPAPDAVSAGWTLLNGTPVGLWPLTRGMPLLKDDLAWCGRIYDTIYNPVATRLVLAARSRGIPAKGGLGMLFSQALAAQRIWNPTAMFPEQAMQQVRQALARAIVRQFPLKIVLSGFMGSGKSTIGQLLAEQMGMQFVDLDHLIEQQSGRSIPDLFATDGEAAFRVLERRLLKNVLDRPDSLVLATGGGALVGEDASQVLADSAALVVFLDVTMDTVYGRVGSGQGRPMLAGKNDNWEKLYQMRRPRYLALADLAVDAGRQPGDVVMTIKENMGLEGSL
jgi:shikimate dehydrogenase